MSVVMGADVSPDKRAIAEQAVIDAAAELGIPAPPVLWWKEAPGPGIWGWVTATPERRAGVINLVASMPLEAVRGMVFHEARHIWQDATDRYYFEPIAAEEDAAAWTYRKTGFFV